MAEAPSPAVGKIQSLTGSARIILDDGVAVSAEVGACLFQGNVIETGADGRVGITLSDGTAFNLSGDARIALADFGYDAKNGLSSAQVKVSSGKFAFVAGKAAALGGLAIETPFATIRSQAQAGAICTLTLVAFTIALVQKLEAAITDPLLLDGLIQYKDLRHGTLVIVPKGGDQKVIVLDDPEMSVIIGPPDLGYIVSQIANSPAEMALLLQISQEAANTYLQGLADPLTTATIQKAETQLFLPSITNIQFASIASGLLPPLPDEPGLNEDPETSGSDNFPTETAAPTLVLTGNTLVLSQDETPGQGTPDPFPVSLAGIAGIGSIADLGRTEDGNPFVSTAGSVFTGSLVITLEANSEGVYSGLDVTGGDSIFLFTETTAGGAQVVVGREGPNSVAAETGDIAFIIYVTEDGQTLWVQQTLPIEHPPDNDPDSVLPIINSALLVRATVTDGATTVTKTLPVGNQVVFEDDGPVANDDDPQVVAEDAASPIGGNVINPEAADDPDASGKDTPGSDGAKLTHVDIGAGFVAITSGVDVGGGFYEHTNSFGTYTFNENGSWTFDPEPNQANPVDASFFYRLTDGDGDTDEAKQPITVVDGNGPSSDAKLTLVLKESDLDTAMTGDEDSGTLTFTAGSDDLTGFTFGSTAGIVVQGLLGAPVITWSGDDTDTIVGQIDGVDAITLKVTGSTIEAGGTDTVTVTATLLDNFPHALAGADSILIGGIVVNASEDDGNFATAQVRVRVLDDVPVALDDSAEVQAQSTLATVNALVVLDRSGSMDQGSRLSLAKQAILDFASQPNVLSIQILSFASTAGAASIWFDVSNDDGRAALEAFLNSISAGGGTNYQAALLAAEQAWIATPPPNNDADLTNIYFVSDGAPSSPLTSAQKTAWETFLANPDNGIDNAYAIGIGTGVNDADLLDVAYPNDADNVIIISSAGDLSATLQSTTLFGTVSGNVIDNLTADAADDDDFGADGPGFVKTLRYDSDGDGVLEDTDSIYSFDGTNIDLNGVQVLANAHEITLETGFGGSLTFNFLTGAWTYSTPTSFDAQFVERFSYTIVDGEGDESAPAALNITVLAPPPTYALTGAPDVVEGNPLIFTLALSHPSAEDIAFRLATADGTATGGSDFEVSGFRYSTDNGATWIDATGPGLDEVTILAGQTSILIEVGTIDDSLDESAKESMQLVVDQVVSGTAAAAGNDGSETGLIRDNDNVAPAINAPGTMNYWTTPPGSNTDVTFINRISFQDADTSTGIVLVTLNVGNGGGAFEASSGGGVTVAGSGTSLMTLTGTIAAINAFIGGNKIEFDPPGTSLADRVLTVTIDDNDGGITSTNITLHHQSLSNLDSDSPANVNLSGWNFNDVDVNMGNGNDTVVTSWSHGPDNDSVNYNGEGGSDTITLVFTPAQLEEILTDDDDRDELDDFLEDTDDNNLTFGGTDWNASAFDFEDANLALAAGPVGYAVYGPANSSTGIPGSTSADSGNDYLQGTGGSNTINGQGGNDIILGLGGNDTLNGGAGSDLILGGAGNDRIDGGADNDLLSGGAGADTFVAGPNPGLDAIVDYSFAEGDMLDLSALVDANFGVVSSNIDDFVKLTQTDGDINVFVDVNGTGTFGAGSQVFTLVGGGTASSNDPVKIYLENAEHTLTV
ncbi:MAG: VWA domain-containing protein [Bradyrhizobiaceae bacterium]|nr:VWA domain-containing protein [Bradyrhizobiaceae bacterium]